MAHHHDDGHHHHHAGHGDDEGEGTYGMAFGFRTIEQDGELYLVEAEIAPYVDEAAELGATLVFHRLEWIDPSAAEEAEVPAWALDIDDDLLRKGSDPLDAQFAAIVRQLHGISEGQLREYLAVAREEAEEG